MKLTTLFILSIIIAAFIFLLSRTQYVEPSRGASLAPPEVKKAMQKMGPHKDYRLLPSSEGEKRRLEVLVKGKWLKLRY